MKKAILLILVAAGLAGCSRPLSTANPGINRTLSVPITVSDNSEAVYVVIYTNGEVSKEGVTEDIKALQEISSSQSTDADAALDAGGLIGP